MTIGGSIALLVIGAILRYAINWSSAYVDLRLVGLILMIAGAAGLIIALTLIMTRRQRSAPRTEVYEQRHYTESPPGYNRPRQGYNQPPPNYNQPPGSYNEPQGSYNQPPPNYNEPPGSYNQPPGSHTEPLPGPGEPPRDYTEPPTEVYEQRRYNEPPH
jgi:Domain of unknown function (DUF6458)